MVPWDNIAKKTTKTYSETLNLQLSKNNKNVTAEEIDKEIANLQVNLSNTIKNEMTSDMKNIRKDYKELINTMNYFQQILTNSVATTEEVFNLTSIPLDKGDQKPLKAAFKLTDLYSDLLSKLKTQMGDISLDVIERIYTLKDEVIKQIRPYEKSLNDIELTAFTQLKAEVRDYKKYMKHLKKP